MFIQSDGKHLRTIKKVLNVEGAKGSATRPVAGGSNYAQGEVCLSEEDVKKFKTYVGELMYVCRDRPDCQYAIRERTRSLKSPTVSDMQSLVRLARYLIKTEEFGVKFEHQQNLEYRDCYSDTDWGNCKRTRKSTACGVFKVGSNTLASVLQRFGNDLLEQW